MSPQFPHVSEIQYTLLGIPELDISVFPVSRKLPDVLDLPGIRGFVRQSIAAGCQAFVAPASGTVDLASIMSPTRIGDTQALGVFMITIHEARDLHDKDLKGKSDPYIVLAYGKVRAHGRCLLRAKAQIQRSSASRRTRLGSSNTSSTQALRRRRL